MASNAGLGQLNERQAWHAMPDPVLTTDLNLTFQMTSSTRSTPHPQKLLPHCCTKLPEGGFANDAGITCKPNALGMGNSGGYLSHYTEVVGFQSFLPRTFFSL